jgi:hypothetical protein
VVIVIKKFMSSSTNALAYFVYDGDIFCKIDTCVYCYKTFFILSSINDLAYFVNEESF